MPPASYPSTGPELRTGIGGVTECPWDPTFPVEGHIRLFLAWPLPHFWPRGGPAARPRGVNTHRAGGERCAGTTGLRASLQRDNHICFIGRTSPSDPAGSEEGRRDRRDSRNPHGRNLSKGETWHLSGQAPAESRATPTNTRRCRNTAAAQATVPVRLGPENHAVPAKRPRPAPLTTTAPVSTFTLHRSAMWVSGSSPDPASY